MSKISILFFAALISLGDTYQTPSKQIPPDENTSSDKVNQWWERLRAAGSEAAKAWEQKEAVLKEKRKRRGPTPDNEDELLSKNDWEKMNAEIARATGNYLGL